MFNTSSQLLLFALLAGVSRAEEPMLIPQPRSVERGVGELALRAPVRIELLSDSEEDHFAAELLARELRDIHQLDVAVCMPHNGEPLQPGTIRIGRPGERRIDAEMAARKLDTSAFEYDEGYLLSVAPTGVLIAAKTPEGIFYGVQTLRQLIGPGAAIPVITVSDWPAIRYRALSIDISRGPILTEDQLQAAVRNAAELKLNMIFLYMEHVFRYAHAPLPMPENGQVSAEMIRRLGAYARHYHVDLASHQQYSGHLHNLLKYEIYAGMGEIPHGSVLSPADERTYHWIQGCIRQLTDAFPSQFVKIGSDETWELGEGRSRQSAAQTGVGDVYLAHLTRIEAMVRAMGKQPLYAGADMALKHPEIIPKLSKDLIAIPWAYDVRADYTPIIEPFSTNGLQFFFSTTVHNWNRPFPNFSRTRGNANGFARDAKRLGALGMIVTEWRDDGEALFNTLWYGAAFSAAAAWQAGMVDIDSFDRAFDWAFYRSSGKTFVKAIRDLAAAHDLLRSVGANECDSNLYWTDPFSQHGARRVRKAYPVASQMRVLAEQAMINLAANRQQARAHGDTIRFLELAAKRIDYLGMKIMFSKEIGDIYRDMLANPTDARKVRNSLRRIRGMDGLLPSLRDYSTEVRASYRDAWLAENRPYWLDNVLVRFDAECLGWVQKMALFEGVASQWETTKSLPTIDNLGITLP